jgi:hypothetical protein
MLKYITLSLLDIILYNFNFVCKITRYTAFHIETHVLAKIILQDYCKLNHYYS